MNDTDRTACPRENPHPSHYWQEEGWKPPHPGARQHLCLGIVDPAVEVLTDDQLKLAGRELGRREEARTARTLREDEKFRQRQVAEGELSFKYREKLAALLAGVKVPGSVRPVSAKLLEDVSDLMYDYREEQENL